MEVDDGSSVKIFAEAAMSPELIDVLPHLDR